LFNAGKISSDFDNSKIGLIPVGGNNIKFFVEQKLLLKLNRKYAVVIDSDRESADRQISEKTLRWKNQCEQQGGKLYILRKREIENYLYPEAVKRALNKEVRIEDFNNVNIVSRILCNHLEQEK